MENERNVSSVLAYLQLGLLVIYCFPLIIALTNHNLIFRASTSNGYVLQVLFS